MLVMRPNTVTYGARVLEDIERVSVDSFGEDMAEGWGNEGPNLVFADAVRRRTVVRLKQLLGTQSDLSAPDLGDLQQLRVKFVSGGDARELELVTDGVVQSVTHAFNASGAAREIRMLCVSDEGDEDPVTIIGGGGS